MYIIGAIGLPEAVKSVVERFDTVIIAYIYLERNKIFILLRSRCLTDGIPLLATAPSFLPLR